MFFALTSYQAAAGTPRVALPGRVKVRLATRKRVWRPRNPSNSIISQVDATGGIHADAMGSHP